MLWVKKHFREFGLEFVGEHIFRNLVLFFMGETHFREVGSKVYG